MLELTEDDHQRLCEAVRGALVALQRPTIYAQGVDEGVTGADGGVERYTRHLALETTTTPGSLPGNTVATSVT